MHLHSERTICHDGEVIISSKKVLCDPHVEITLGPVIGLVTHCSVRLLLETSKKSIITCNLFQLEELSELQEGRYLFSEVFKLKNC